MFMLFVIAVPLTGSAASLQPSQPDFPQAILLVSGDSVRDNLGSNNLVIIDARTAGYDISHIPGAINMLFGQYFTSGTGLLPVATLNSMLSAKGLTSDATYVIYDNTSASWGAAGRIFWMLEYLGCKDVHILDGGWDKWFGDGKPTETSANILPASTFQASPVPSIRSDKKYIAGRYKSADFVVMDCRTDEEYIGWQLYGEARGGHIPGAVQVPYAWYFSTDKTLRNYAELTMMFQSRGITRDKEVTAHCTVGIRSGFAYFVLRLMGYPRASNYDASIVEWAADKKLPMEIAPNFSTIVHPSWVKAVIDYHAPGSATAAPSNYPYARDHKYLIFQTSWAINIADDSDYINGHVPGAIHLGTGAFEDGEPTWYLSADAAVHQTMSNNGITADTTVIIYSDAPYDDGTPWGIGWSARLFWILKYAGLNDVRILNGGYKDWLGAGYAGDTGTNLPAAATFTGSVHPEYLATTAYVAKKLKSGAISVGDVRKYDEYAGATSGYATIEARGRVPGAVWLSDAGSSSLVYHNSDGTLSSYTDVRNLWKARGITSAKPIVFYCGAGYRSALAFLHGYVMGYKNIRNYASGWFDWSTVFEADPSYTGGLTPGWRQVPSVNSIVLGSPVN
jgi:3-mercaptopyruvate sulfurtransferase SseA